VKTAASAAQFFKVYFVSLLIHVQLRLPDARAHTTISCSLLNKLA